MISWRQRLKYFYCLIIVLCTLIDSNESSCCDIIRVISSGPLSSFHPEHLGTYKLASDNPHIYQSVTEKSSYIYLLRFGRKEIKWVMGKNPQKSSIIASWPQRPNLSFVQPRLMSIFNFFGRKRRTDQVEAPSDCPLDGDTNRFQVWDGYRFVNDATLQIECSVEKIDTVEGCCETIRVASAISNSVSMQTQRSKMGVYKAVGRMNGFLVYHQVNPSTSNYVYTWQDKQGVLRWHVGSNFTLNDHGIESMNAINADCITDLTDFNVYTKYPNHLFDESNGWHFDPSLRIECYDTAIDCCPTVEVTSSGDAATFFPHLLGTYIMSNDYQVSGRRVYRQRQEGQFIIYLHDWGPKSGMEWIFARSLGDPSFKSLSSANVENAFPLNMCLTDASNLAPGWSVWDGRKWRSDPTLKISCTFFY